MSHEPLRYPEARKCDQVDDYHGTQVADPYRWLEDADSDETREWVAAKDKLTRRFIAAIPARDRIRARLESLWDYERFGLPFREGRRYFYTRNDGLQNQSVLYVADTCRDDGRVLLDPNALSDDGTVALSGLAVSRDGGKVAYSLARAGSDWQEWHVLDVETGQSMEDHLRWSKFSGASWLPDGSGFFYCRYAEPAADQAYQQANYNQKLCLHLLGRPQEDDAVVYERPDHKEWGFGHEVTEDGRYLVISVWEGTQPNNRLFYLPLGHAGASMVELIPDADASYGFIGNDGTRFFVHTDRDAPNGRVMAVDTRAPSPDEWVEVIGECNDSLQAVSLVGDRLVAQYLEHARTRVSVYALDGVHEHEVAFPGPGTARGFGGKRALSETFYSYGSFTHPDAVYRYDVDTCESMLVRAPRTSARSDDFETVQVFYTSKDGTRIPMFITRRKGIALNGAHPTLLYGYGGFRIALTPGYSPAVMAWLEMGGVYAVPNLRGGSEYGTPWHDAGRLANKQNVFDDFIAAAEWLIREGYTRPSRLAIFGGSNGGLLVGACVTQRPDLCGAASAAVGVLDMLRFHRYTIGWGWVSDYGCADDPEQFRVLMAYSPLHNLAPGTHYPATLITTGDHDDRVVPAHSFKFAAAMQAAQGGPAPVLIRIETRAGHGAGKPTRMVIDEAADRWAFIAHALHMPMG